MEFGKTNGSKGGMSMKDRTILHYDCNGFYASVECLFDPELKKVPMAVGGDSDSRHDIILAKIELAKEYSDGGNRLAGKP